MTPPAATRQQGGAAARQPAQAAPQVVIPFVGASHEHVEPIATWSVTPGTASQDSVEYEVPAYGYLRNILVEVEATGGALGAGALTADYPWNIFESVALYDVNGAPIYGPVDGFGTLLSNIFGGYAYEQDPRQSPSYVETVNPSFHFRIPVELSHSDGMGSISNQSAAASYKVRLRVRNLASLITGGTPTAPALTIRLFLEAWSVPDDHDLQGRPQVQLPPAHGTSQYWTRQQYSVINGRNTVRFTRMGNMIRNLVLVARDATGARSDTVLTNAAGDPIRLTLDGRDLKNQSRSSLIREMHERLNDVLRATSAGAGTPSLFGVYHFSYNHALKNHSGDGPPALWLPTVQSSRLELDATTGAAGTWELYTNDVAPVEVTPAERFIETSETGFRPEVGTPAATPAGR